jgi:Leucine-rich repeat (LRR) protein
LEAAKACKFLNIAKNQIQDLSPLAGWGKLIQLNCSKNQISDFTPIQHLPIVNLNCANNPIKNYHFLQKLSHLNTLDCSKTALSSLLFLDNCPYIEKVICKENPISVLPSRAIPTLRCLEISNQAHCLPTEKFYAFRRLNPQCTIKFS